MWTFDPQVSLIRLLIHDNRAPLTYSDGLLRAAVTITRNHPPLPKHVLLAAMRAWNAYPSDVSGGPWRQTSSGVVIPSIRFISPANGAVYAVGQNVVVSYSASASGGIFNVNAVSGGVSYASGSVIHMGAAGTFSMTVTAWSKSGGQLTSTHTWTVA